MLFFFGLQRLARFHPRKRGEGSFLVLCPFMPENFLDTLSFILLFGGGRRSLSKQKGI